MKKILLGMTAIAASATLVAACSSNDSTPKPTTTTTPAIKQRITVGALLDLTGDGSTLGQASKTALLDAVTDLRAQGIAVTLDIEDSQSTPAGATAGYTALADKGIHAIIGAQASSEAQAILPLANAAGILLVSQGSTASSLAIPNDALYRMVPTDKVESRATVDLMAKQSRNHLVTVGRDDAGNQGLITSVTAGMPSSVTVAVPAITYPTTTPVPTAPIVTGVQSALASSGASAGRQPAVYLAGFGEVSDVLAALGGANLASDLSIYGGDGSARASSVTANATAAKFAASHGGFPSPLSTLDAKALAASAPLRARMAKSGVEPDAFSLGAYDALQIIAKADAASPGATGSSLWNAFAKAANGYQGVTGTITLDAAGDRADGAYAFWSVCAKNGAYEWTQTGTWEPNGAAGTITSKGC